MVNGWMKHFPHFDWKLADGRAEPVTDLPDWKLAYGRTVLATNLPDKDDIQEVVKKHLKSCGNIEHVGVGASCTPMVGCKSRKQVAVVFSSKAEADQAVWLTGTFVEGRHIFISKPGQYSPSCRSVLLSNIPPKVVEEDLWQSLKHCGNILYIHIGFHGTACYAEIYFKYQGSAEKAVKGENTTVRGKVISVTVPPFVKRSNTQKFPVVIPNLPKDVQHEDLKKDFSGYGKILLIKFNRTKTAATIFYEDEKAAEEAVKRSGKAVYRHPTILPLPELSQLVNPLVVAGAPQKSRDEEVFFKFQECGLIESIKHLVVPDPLHKNFIIQFKEAESVKKALALKDLSLHGCDLLISDSFDILRALSPVKAASPGKALKRKVGPLLGNECVETDDYASDDHASDGTVKTSVSSQKKKKKA